MQQKKQRLAQDLFRCGLALSMKARGLWERCWVDEMLVYGIWFMVYGLWFIVDGGLYPSTVNSQLSTVNRQPSTVNQRH